MNLVELLSMQINPFAWDSAWMFMVGWGFLCIAPVLHLLRRFRSWPLLTTACVWILYAIWEAYCENQNYNIRVDLMLLPPILVIVTVWGIVIAWLKR
jgi:hypothetical protein